MSTADTICDYFHATRLGAADSRTFRTNAPWRSDSDSKSLVVTIHGAEHGRYYDHVEKSGGSLYALAERLGVEITRPDGRKYVPNMADYAASHGMTEQILRDYGWTTDTKVIDGKRTAALRFTTATGSRWRILDPTVKRKFTHDRGYRSCWYRLEHAVAMAKERNAAVVLCNGEASVCAAQHYGIAATAVTSSGERALPEDLLQEFRKKWDGPVAIAMDCDDTGRRASHLLATQLTGLGYAVTIHDLGLGAKEDLGDFCALHTTDAPASLQKCIREGKADDPWKSIGMLAIDLQKSDRRPPRWIIPGILTQGAAILAGAPKSRKTWLAAQLAWGVATGGTVFGDSIVCEQGDVLYLDFEMTRDNVATRFAAMSERDQLWPARLRVVTIEDEFPRGEEGLALIEAWCQDHPERALVIVDVLANLRGSRQRGENLYDEDLMFTQSINRLAERYRVGIIGVMHLRKMVDAHKSNMISGTTGMTGGVSLSMVLSKSPTDDSMNELYREGRHLINSDPLALKWDPYQARHVLVGSVMEAALSVERKRLLSILHRNEEMTIKELSIELQKPDSTVYSMCQWLLSQSLIDKTGRGKYAVRRSNNVVGLGRSIVSVGFTDNIYNPIESDSTRKPLGNGITVQDAQKDLFSEHIRKSDDISNAACISAPKPLDALGWIWRDATDPVYELIPAAHRDQFIRGRSSEHEAESVTSTLLGWGVTTGVVPFLKRKPK
jgi:hypothetical protein